MSPTSTAGSTTSATPSELPGEAVSAKPSHPSVKAPPATVLALIAHARGVPSVAREAFAAECDALRGSDAVIIVHTCHRVEIYIALAAYGAGPLPQLPSGGLRLEDAAAVSHLISVTCGLKSAVLGEDQILHQVRETYTVRHGEQPLNPVLERLFQVALNAGRHAHEWFSGSKRSLGDAALDTIEAKNGPLMGKPILIIGAGSMGRLTAQAAVRRGAQIIVWSRTAERAVRLAGDVGGRAVTDAADGTFPDVVGVVVALSGRWQVNTLDAQNLLDGEATVVDLSSPPAVPDDLQNRLADRFVSIDDLAWGAQAELPGKLRTRLERLVTESGGEYCRWLRARDSTPAIQALTEAAETRRLSELERLMRKLPDLSEQDRAVIEQMSHRLVAGILHAPKSALRLDENGTLGRAAWELFGL